MTVQVTGIAHIGLRVHDLAVARRFYEVLGFEFKVGPIGPEPVAIMVHPKGIELNLILNAAHAGADNILMDVATKHAGYTHVALAISDIDAATATLAAAGFPIAEGPVEFPGGARAVFVRDPDRNVVELNQAP